MDYTRNIGLSSYLNIDGLRTGPGKLFLGPESRGLFVGKREWEPCSYIDAQKYTGPRRQQVTRCVDGDQSK